MCPNTEGYSMMILFNPLELQPCYGAYTSKIVQDVEFDELLVYFPLKILNMLFYSSDF